MHPTRQKLLDHFQGTREDDIRDAIPEIGALHKFLLACIALCIARCYLFALKKLDLQAIQLRGGATENNKSCHVSVFSFVRPGPGVSWGNLAVSFI